ncbi:hypothetical protein LINPERPRIM_LOCUS14167 [Linum perenne]
MKLELNTVSSKIMDTRPNATVSIALPFDSSTSSSLETKQLLRRSGPGWKVASFDASAFPPEVPVFFQTQPIDLAASDLSSLSRQAD